ncbi:MAG: stage V sporulation protein S, partial [Coriobacteriales bacterium]|nr:stage V sporulation protein S [Coriobacteriales bacterium]
SIIHLKFVPPSAITRGFLSPCAIGICGKPSFSEVPINGEQKTAIRFSIEAYLVDEPVSLDEFEFSTE